MAKLTRQIRIESGADKVWEVLSDIGGVAKWAPTVNHAVTLTSAKSGVGCERECDVAGFGKIRERFVEWDEGRSYTYEVTDAGPMRYVRNTWSVDAAGEGSIVTVETDFRVKFGLLGALMVPMVGIMMRKQLKLSLAGLKYHVETGDVVDSKLPKSAIAAA